MQAEKLFRDGFESIVLIRFISNYLQKIYQAKCDIQFGSLDFEGGGEGSEIIFKTEIEFRKNLNALSLDFLTNNLFKLSELEAKIKTNSLPSKLLFVRFIHDLKNC